VAEPLSLPSTSGALRPPSLVDAVVQRLQTDILNGSYPPGSYLPPERELADELAVTRNSLSQAFARLRELGLLETKHGVGTRVRDYERFGGLELLPALITANASGWAKEIFEVRRELGAFVAARAARKGTAKQRKKIAAACEAVRAAQDADAAQLAECEVHRLIAAATGNRVYGLAVNAVLAGYLTVRHFLQEPFRDPAAAADRLKPMVDAVVSGDPDAAHAETLAYLAATKRLMIGDRR
jgi:GntR family transcriptional regulator, transcriptional repressor for pyruvate dehydrogenase complex